MLVRTLSKEETELLGKASLYLDLAVEARRKELEVAIRAFELYLSTGGIVIEAGVKQMKRVIEYSIEFGLSKSLRMVELELRLYKEELANLSRETILDRVDRGCDILVKAEEVI